MRSLQLNNRRQAFSRIDLIVCVLAVGALGGWFASHHLGEAGRIARCTHNLKVLGEAMHSFANDHGDGLPPAGIEPTQVSWDMQLYSYLKPSLAKSKSDASDEMVRAVAPYFFCPSDPIKRGERPRSYAVSSHDMATENWPPRPDNSTGVGLWWSKGRITQEFGEEALEKVKKDADFLAMVKLSYLTDPANTLLLTELNLRDNRMKSVLRIRVGSVEEQVAAFEGDLSQFHDGRFNYLMADGHVELQMLSPFPTGAGGPSGIWTIRKGD